MRLGLSLSSVQLTEDYALGAKNIIERARVANAVQLDSLTIGDRHSMFVPYYQNVPVIGRLMAEWDAERPIGCLFLFPLWNPVLAAEQIATLACMTDAPFVIQAAIGSDPGQFAAMGADHSKRGRALDESIRVVKGLLAGERMSSEHFGVEDAGIKPLPPRNAEWWVCGGVHKALERVAAHGDAWYADAHITVDETREKISEYEELCGAVGRTPRSIVRKDVLILRDGNKANRIGDEMIERNYRNLRRDAVAYGSVAEVIDQLGAFAEMGVDDMIVRSLLVDEPDALETIELAGEVRSALL